MAFEDPENSRILPHDFDIYLLFGEVFVAYICSRRKSFISALVFLADFLVSTAFRYLLSDLVLLSILAIELSIASLYLKVRLGYLKILCLFRSPRLEFSKVTSFFSIKFIKRH